MQSPMHPDWQGQRKQSTRGGILKKKGKERVESFENHRNEGGILPRTSGGQQQREPGSCCYELACVLPTVIAEKVARPNGDLPRANQRLADYICPHCGGRIGAMGGHWRGALGSARSGHDIAGGSNQASLFQCLSLSSSRAPRFPTKAATAQHSHVHFQA